MADDQPRRRLIDAVNLHAEGFTVDQALRMLHALEREIDAQTRVTISITINLGPGGGRVRPLDIDET